LLENPTWRWKIAQTLEYKWWQRYLKNKDAFEYLGWKFHYWQDVLLRLSKVVELPQSKTILDAGCGPAGIFIALKGNTVDAVDPLLDKYENLPHFSKEKYLWTQFHQQSIEQITAVEKYDIIYCMNAINHVENIELCYDNLVRALKPEGFLIISTDAHKHNFLKKIFQLIPGDILHPYQFNLAEYNAFLTKRNCVIIEDILYKEEGIFNYYITVAQKK
jgi:2-polyprenyl-6-hydroxyphenyl methylase/3-demethylubiquinone-9 3-methyltransferase